MSDFRALHCSAAVAPGSSPHCRSLHSFAAVLPLFLLAMSLLSLSAEEQQTHAQMAKQFGRFDLMANEVKKRVEQLEPALQAPPAEPDTIAPLVQTSYLHLLELKGIARALTNLAEQTKAQMQAVRAHRPARRSRGWRSFPHCWLMLVCSAHMWTASAQEAFGRGESAVREHSL